MCDLTAGLDCLRRDLDLEEVCVCEVVDWLGAGVPDWGHDLSVPQSVEQKKHRPRLLNISLLIHEKKDTLRVQGLK